MWIASGGALTFSDTPFFRSNIQILCGRHNLAKRDNIE